MRLGRAGGLLVATLLLWTFSACSVLAGPVCAAEPSQRVDLRFLLLGGPTADHATVSNKRVRTDKVDEAGSVPLRTGGWLHHIGVGRTHAGTHVLLLVQDLHVRVIDAATGALLHELNIDPTRDYQPSGRPPGPTRK